MIAKWLTKWQVHRELEDKFQNQLLAVRVLKILLILVQFCLKVRRLDKLSCLIECGKNYLTNTELL